MDRRTADMPGMELFTVLKTPPPIDLRPYCIAATFDRPSKRQPGTDLPGQLKRLVELPWNLEAMLFLARRR